jgi:hypothetical protein
MVIVATIIVLVQRMRTAVQGIPAIQEIAASNMNVRHRKHFMIRGPVEEVHMLLVHSGQKSSGLPEPICFGNMVLPPDTIL